MGRKIIEEINGSTMNTIDGASVDGASAQLPIKKFPIIGTGTGESGTPSTPSAEVPSKDPAGGSGTVSGEGSGSGETGGGESSKTYADYITEGYERQKGIINSNFKSYEQFWNGYLANAESSNAKGREAAEQRAETERQRGVIDGQASYDFNKATYGNQAEALRSMGLSGSGYADYLTSRAYATQRAEVQEANAQAATAKREAREAEARANATAKETANKGIFDAKVARDSALADAEATYLEGMLKFEENKDITYKTLIEAAASGTYSPEVITRMAQEAGLDDTQIAEITNTYETSKSEKDSDEKTAAYASLLDLAKKGGYTPDELTKLAEAQGLDESQITDITAAATTAINEKNSEKDESAQGGKNAAYIDLLALAGEGKYSDDLLKEIAAAKGLTETEIAKILEINSSSVKKIEEEQQEIEEEQEEQKYTENYYIYKDGLLAGTVTPDDVEDALADGLISQTEYDKLKKKYNRDFDTSTRAFKDGNDNYKSRADALEILADIKENSWLSDKNKTDFENSFNAKYTASTYSGLGLKDDYQGGVGDGNNLIFTMTEGGEVKKYKVESDGKINNTDIIEASKSVEYKTIFAYDGKLYFRAKDGSVISIVCVPSEKNMGNKSGYARLCKLFGITG